MVELLLIVFGILIVIGCPVSFSIGLSSLISILLKSDVPLVILPQKMFGGINRFVLLALPFYIMVGVVMEQLELTGKLVKISDALVGHMKGSLAQVNIVASIIFGGIQGSGNADAAALGSVLIPTMIKKGYKPGYSCAVTAASAQIAPIIPPSVMMIIYASITGDSVGKMFLGGIFPGLSIGILFMILAYFYAIKGAQTSPIEHSFSLFYLLKTVKENAFILGIPFLIIGGILGGVFTPTEAGVVTVVYSFIITVVFYRSKISWGKIKLIFFKASTTSAMVLIIVSSGSLFNWILATEQIPQKVINFLIGLNLSPVAMTLSIFAMLFIVGMFMDCFASMVILVPILYPLGQQIGMDPTQFGILVVLSLCIGAVTPPLGLPLFVTIGIAKCSAEEAFKASFPFVIVLVIGTLLVAFVPELTTFIPSLIEK